MQPGNDSRSTNDARVIVTPRLSAAITSSMQLAQALLVGEFRVRFSSFMLVLKCCGRGYSRAVVKHPLSRTVHRSVRICMRGLAAKQSMVSLARSRSQLR